MVFAPIRSEAKIRNENHIKLISQTPSPIKTSLNETPLIVSTAFWGFNVLSKGSKESAMLPKRNTKDCKPKPQRMAQMNPVNSKTLSPGPANVKMILLNETIS